MDACSKSPQEQSEDQRKLEASDYEEKPRVYDGSNWCSERGKIGTIENAQLEGSETYFKHALSQLNVWRKKKQDEGIDDLFHLKDSLNGLAGLNSLAEDKEMQNPSKYEVRKPKIPKLENNISSNVTSQNHCLSESSKDIIERKILPWKTLSVVTSEEHTEILACATGSAEKDALRDSCCNSMSDGSGSMSKIKVESNTVNEIAKELLNLLREDEPKEDETAINDVVNTLQEALKSLTGQQSIEEKRNNKDTLSTFGQQDAGREPDALTLQPLVDKIPVTNNDIALNSTDVTRDSVDDSSTELGASELLANREAQEAITRPGSCILRSFRRTKVSAPSENVSLPRKNTLNTINGELNFNTRRQKDSSHGSMVSYNALEAHMPLYKLYDVLRSSILEEPIECVDLEMEEEEAVSDCENGTKTRNSFLSFASSVSEPRENNRILNGEILDAEQSVTTSESNSDDIQIIASVSRPSSRKKTGIDSICSLCSEEFPNGALDLEAHIKLAHGRFKRFRSEM